MHIVSFSFKSFRIYCLIYLQFFFFFNDTATTEIYTLSLHDALPIGAVLCHGLTGMPGSLREWGAADRKSTRLNSSHSQISYAVFCLKKKKTHIIDNYKKKKKKKKKQKKKTTTKI